MVVSRHTEEYLDLCAEYALGTIDDVSRRRLEAHLQDGCAECEAALRDFGAATTAFAATAPAISASKELRSRVITAAEREPRRRGPRRGVPMAVAGVLAAASVVFLATTIALWTQVRKLSGEQSALRARLDGVEQELAQARTTVAFLTGTGTDCFDFAPTGQADTTMVARGCFNPSSGEALLTLDQVRVPAGRDVEVWVLRGEAPTSLGLVRPDAQGHAIVHVPALANASAVTAFAVSIEAQGGSIGAGPAGPVVSVGALRS
jgi:anti-sigma-K factor RskA